MRSINPTTGEFIKEYHEHSTIEVAEIISSVDTAWLSWRETSFDYRADLFHRLAEVLREDKDNYARLITNEMGKIIRESSAEVEKCAVACDYFADNSAALLADEIIPTDAGRSFVAFQPLGVVLAVMPWNFPFWQVIRFAAPSLMAGNVGLLKHASNVPGCASALEELFLKAGFPDNVFRTLMIPSLMVESVIDNPLVKAVTLTGSELAGSRVASAAGRNIKKTLLELGGSDPFIILQDADMDKAVKTAVTARMINQGQSCIAAKRFIVVESRINEFEQKICTALSQLIPGHPLDNTTDIGPMARKDLVDDLDMQVQNTIKMGARLLLGGRRIDRTGFYYQPTVLTNVVKGMPAYSEETFGPVVNVIAVKDEYEAIKVANDSEFGLGGSVWTQDLERGERVARRIETGAVFVNGLTKSDPRLPFGGIKKSGYGRELSSYGIKEFVNIKTVWVGE